MFNKQLCRADHFGPMKFIVGRVTHSNATEIGTKLSTKCQSLLFVRHKLQLHEKHSLYCLSFYCIQCYFSIICILHFISFYIFSLNFFFANFSVYHLILFHFSFVLITQKIINSFITILLFMKQSRTNPEFTWLTLIRTR